MKKITIYKNTLSAAMIVMLAMLVSACGSSSSSDKSVKYDGPSTPAPITAQNASELTTKALGVGFAGDLDTAYAGSISDTAKSTKAMAKVMYERDALEYALSHFLGEFIDDPDNPVLGYGGLNEAGISSYGGYIENDTWPGHALYSGELTNEVTFNAETSTFTVKDTFTDAKIVKGKDVEWLTKKELIEANGIVEQVFGYDFNGATPVGDDDAAKLSWALRNATELKHTKNCNGLMIKYTYMDEPIDTDTHTPDYYAEGYGNYDTYNKVITNSYMFDGTFSYADTNAYEDPSDGMTGSGTSTNNTDSTYTGKLTFDSTVSNHYDNFTSEFHMDFDGTATVAYYEKEVDVTNPEASALAKGTYVQSSTTTEEKGSYNLTGAISFTLTNTDTNKVETLTGQIIDGSYIVESAENSEVLTSGSLANLEDGDKYIDRSDKSTSTMKTTISGDAKLKLEVQALVLDDAAQVVDFALDSGSVTFGYDNETTAIAVFDYDDKLIEDESSLDVKNTFTASISGSAKVTHNEMFASVSGEVLLTSEEIKHDANYDGYYTYNARLDEYSYNVPGDHYTDIDTKTSVLTVNNVSLKTDFIDVGLQGTITQNIDYLSDNYDSSATVVKIDMVVDNNTTQEDYWFSDYVISAYEDDKKSSCYWIEATATGRFYHSRYGYVDVETIEEFEFGSCSGMMPMKVPGPESFNIFPVYGEAEISGADNSKASFTVISTNDGPSTEPLGYTIEADVDGDSKADFTATQMWPDFDGALENYWLTGIIGDLFYRYVH